MNTRRGELLNIKKGSHVCWVLAEPEDFYPIASAMLDKGREEGEKVVAFGPQGSPSLASLGELGATLADPLHDFLGGGSLRPETMFRNFKDLAEIAREEGYSGIRVIADMDWLLSNLPSTGEIVSFELLLDKMVLELGATVICVYRRSSFDRECLEGVAAVHPYVWGVESHFTLTAEGNDTWNLSGEIDIAALPHFTAALQTVTQQEVATLALDELRFIDCSGMRIMAAALASAEAGVRVRNAPAFLQRFWSLASLDEILPLESVTK